MPNTENVNPNSVHDATGWIDNAVARIDDGDTPNDGDHCEVNTSGGANYGIWGFPATSLPSYAVILSFLQNTRGQGNQNATRNQIEIGGTRYNGSTSHAAVGAVWTTWPDTWTVSPATSLEFTKAEIDGMDGGGIYFPFNAATNNKMSWLQWTITYVIPSGGWRSFLVQFLGPVIGGALTLAEVSKLRAYFNRVMCGRHVISGSEVLRMYRDLTENPRRVYV